jgi:hypothetical protein
LPISELLELRGLALGVLGNTYSPKWNLFVVPITAVSDLPKTEA